MRCDSFFVGAGGGGEGWPLGAFGIRVFVLLRMVSSDYSGGLASCTA